MNSCHPHHSCRTGHRSESGSAVNHPSNLSAEREEGIEVLCLTSWQWEWFTLPPQAEYRGVETRHVLVDIGQAGTQFKGVRDVLLDLFESLLWCFIELQAYATRITGPACTIRSICRLTLIRTSILLFTNLTSCYCTWLWRWANRPTTTRPATRMQPKSMAMLELMILPAVIPLFLLELESSTPP